MKMKLMRRKVEEGFEGVKYSNLSEIWRSGASDLYYTQFHVPRKQFTLELVSWGITLGGQLAYPGSISWVTNIKPIALVHFGEKSPQRIYGASSCHETIEFLIGYEGMTKRNEHGIDDYLSNLSTVFPNNEQSTPQATLERLIKNGKLAQWSWEEMIDFEYECVTKARDVLLSYAKQIPNESVAKVIGDLELKKPEPQSFEHKAPS